MPVPQKGDPKYVEYVINMANTPLIRRGVINEPRVLFSEIAVPTSAFVPAEGDPGVFVNGEPFPLRLTHILAAIRHGESELLAQQVGMRLNYHDQYYMNPRFLPLPVWGNKCVAAPQPTSSSSVHWDFVANGQPFVMSCRDTLVFEVQLQDVTEGETFVVTATLTGVGAMSRRPYLLSGQRTIIDQNPIDLSSVDFRNDGLEPIVITDLTVNLVEETLTPGQSDIRNLRMNVHQIGNASGANWFSGPAAPVAIPRMQASLAGVTTGRSIVHQIPGDGYIWEPGEGISVEVAAIIDGLPADLTACVGLAGYLMVV